MTGGNDKTEVKAAKKANYKWLHSNEIHRLPYLQTTEDGGTDCHAKAEHAPTPTGLPPYGAHPFS